MNPLEAMSPDDQNVIEFSENPGRRLRVLRQSRGLEVERVAAQLHLRVPMVEALEQDRYQDLPGPVFIAGYLRNYARLLGLDPEPLLAAYRQANPEPEPAVLRFKPAPRPDIGSGHILVRLISLGLVVAVIAMSRPVVAEPGRATRRAKPRRRNGAQPRHPAGGQRRGGGHDQSEPHGTTGRRDSPRACASADGGPTPRRVHARAPTALADTAPPPADTPSYREPTPRQDQPRSV